MADYLFKVAFNLTPPGEEPIGQSGKDGIRIEAGEIVTDPPAPHLIGTCGPDCAMNGEHGWGVKDGLVELVGGLIPATEKPVGVAVAANVEVGVVTPAPAPWHSSRGTVHHTAPACSLGNNVEPENRVEGDGGLPLCSECKRLLAAAGEEA